MLKQKHRRACLEAIIKHYNKKAALMADRIAATGYYSIWSIDDRLLEVTERGNEIYIYEYVPVSLT